MWECSSEVLEWMARSTARYHMNKRRDRPFIDLSSHDLLNSYSWTNVAAKELNRQIPEPFIGPQGWRASEPVHTAGTANCSLSRSIPLFGGDTRSSTVVSPNILHPKAPFCFYTNIGCISCHCLYIILSIIICDPYLLQRTPCPLFHTPQVFANKLISLGEYFDYINYGILACDLDIPRAPQGVIVN